MKHDIPDEITNSSIEYCISEYVRLERDRAILIDHWFGGLSFMALAEKYQLSETAIKRVIYDEGDKVLLRADKQHGTMFVILKQLKKFVSILFRGAV